MKTSHKIYVGLSAMDGLEMFWSETEPTPETTPQYEAVIGPFKTKRGAIYCVNYGQGNPHVQCVADAERLAKHYADRKRNRRVTANAA